VGRNSSGQWGWTASYGNGSRPQNTCRLPGGAFTIRWLAAVRVLGNGDHQDLLPADGVDGLRLGAKVLTSQDLPHWWPTFAQPLLHRRLHAIAGGNLGIEAALPVDRIALQVRPDRRAVAVRELSCLAAPIAPRQGANHSVLTIAVYFLLPWSRCLLYKPPAFRLGQQRSDPALSPRGDVLQGPGRLFNLSLARIHQIIYGRKGRQEI
jgi:hypothetical protein